MLDFLAMITFYLAVLFGYGLILLFFFATGRLGIVQIMYWLRAAPLPDGRGQKDQIDALFSTMGIPTSAYGAVISLTPLAWVNEFITILKPFYSVFGRLYAYVSLQLCGRYLGTAYLLVGIPAIILKFVLDKAGHDYLPEFLRLIGVPTESQAIVMSIGGLALAYLAGRLISSPQRRFNQSRKRYEVIVIKDGYWFDHRSDSHYYADHRQELEHTLLVYDSFIAEFRTTKRRDDITIQRLMVLYYQRALALCTVGRYVDAGQAIQRTKQCKDLLQNSVFWEPGELSTFESQCLFLEGEICFVLGQQRQAKTLFQKSLEIDKSNHDYFGMRINKERLALCNTNSN